MNPTREFICLLRDKRIALIGPAGYLTGLGFGEEIDSHDVVIRIGDAHPPKEFQRDYGSKTNIVYSTNKLAPYPKGSHLRFVGIDYPSGPGKRSMPDRQMLRLYRSSVMPAHASKGLVSFLDLIHHDFISCKIYGLTFVQPFTEEIYNPFYKPQPVHTREEFFKIKDGNHDFNKEWKLFNKYLKTDSRLFVDSFLKQFILK